MKIFSSLAQIVRLYAIALWVGGLIFFVVVAQVAFTNLPTTHDAGLVVRGSLLAIHTIGLYAGLAYLLATIVIMAMGDHRNVRGLEFMLVILMLGSTYYSQHSIIPAMESDRIALFQQYGKEVSESPKSAPQHADFDRLHNLSTKVEGGILIGGLIVLALAAFPPKPEAV
jgi:hypothetical protein